MKSSQAPDDMDEWRGSDRKGEENLESFAEPETVGRRGKDDVWRDAGDGIFGGMGWRLDAQARGRRKARRGASAERART